MRHRIPISKSIWPLALAVGFYSHLVSGQVVDNSAPVHTVDGSFVREWLVLGPFRSREMNIDFLAVAGGEASVRPKEGDAVVLADGTPLTWTRLRSKTDWVNSDPAVGLSEWSVAYAYCELESDRACETDVRFGCFAPSTLWVNGKPLGASHQALERSSDAAPVLPASLNAGRNACLLKFHFEREPWQFLFQPLPPSRAIVEVHVTDPAQKMFPGRWSNFTTGARSWRDWNPMNPARPWPAFIRWRRRMI